MFHKFDRVGSKLETCPEAPLPQGAASQRSGPATIIPAYDVSRSTGLFSVTNNVKKFQEFFQRSPSDVPVFLRGRRDLFLYRSVMVFSVFGLGVTFYNIYQMATGSKQKR